MHIDNIPYSVHSTQQGLPYLFSKGQNIFYKSDF